MFELAETDPGMKDLLDQATMYHALKSTVEEISYISTVRLTETEEQRKWRILNTPYGL
jgi:hypothetical protein